MQQCQTKFLNHIFFIKPFKHIFLTQAFSTNNAKITLKNPFCHGGKGGEGSIHCKQRLDFQDSNQTREEDGTRKEMKHLKLCNKIPFSNSFCFQLTNQETKQAEHQKHMETKWHNPEGT